MPFIDLNCDLGESFGRWTLGHDAEVMESISSCNIACGYHAGDPETMRRTVRLARAKQVAVGAHPGFPDLAGFGRRAMSVTQAEAEAFVLYQIGALSAIARAEGVKMRHVKAHGALYNMAIRDRAMADAIAGAVAAFDPSLLLFGLPGTELLRAGRTAGLAVVAEGFADRTYEPDGSLTPRGETDAVIHSPAEVVARAVLMAREGVVNARDGTTIPMRVGTICLHGDTPRPHELARQIKHALEGAGITIKVPGDDESSGS